METIKQIKKGRTSSSKVASSSSSSSSTSEVTDAKVQAVCSLDTNEASCSFMEKPSSRLPPRPPARSTSTGEGLYLLYLPNE